MKPKTVKAKSRVALQREFRRVHKMLMACPIDNGMADNLYGAQQALAWAMGADAAAPAAAFNPKGWGRK